MSKGPHRIPLSNPGAGYLNDRNAVDRAMSDVLRSGQYVLGEQVARFETEFAEYLGAKYAVGVASGTDALQLALRACGVGEGKLPWQTRRERGLAKARRLASLEIGYTNRWAD